MASTYIVKVGDTIRDVCINGTGSMSNWDAILSANGFDTWTPLLTAGQEIVVPDGVFIDTNSFADKKVYPSCNNGPANILDVLQQVFDILADRWLLKDGFWDDTGIWLDTATWIDNP